MANKKEPKPEVAKTELELVRDEMNSLSQHPGWKRITVFLQAKIDWYERLLFDGIEGAGETIEDVRVARARRNIVLQLINLPEILVVAKEKSQGEDINLDPYDKTTAIEGVDNHKFNP